MNKEPIKIFEALVTSGMIKSQTVFSLCRALNKFPHEYTVSIKEGGAIHTDREQAVANAKLLNCTHLMFIDYDMSFERDAILRLLERDKDIIGVHYNQRKEPPTTTVLMDNEKKLNLKTLAPDGLTTCDGVATGFTMIKMSVFDKLKHPYFFFETNDKGELTVSEDYWFCRLAKQAGFEIWVDLSIPIKHVGDKLY